MVKKPTTRKKYAKSHVDSGSETDDSKYNTWLDDNDDNSELDPIEHDVNYAIQSIQSSYLQGLLNFLDTPKFINPSGDPSTNIVDRMKGKCYNVPNIKIPKLFKHIESCRRNNIKIMLTERQQEYSGIMLDFDIYQDTDKTQLNDELFHLLISKIIELLIKLLVFKDKETIYVGITQRPKVTYCESKKCHKDGFHLLIPGVQVTRGVKYLIIKKLIDNEIIDQIFVDVEPADIKINGLEYCKGDFLDRNSAHVPTFFIGSSTKIGHVPYQLTTIYEIKITPSLGHIFPTQKNKILKQREINICHEFSLNWEAPNGIIKKRHYEVADRYLDEIRAIYIKTCNEPNEDEEARVKNNGELSTNSIHDRNVKEIRDLLDTLHVRRAEEYSLWRDVVFALANTSKSYRYLAEYFSRKSKKFNMVSFDNLWTNATMGDSSCKKLLTISSLHYWAKQDNPDRYNEVRKDNVTNVLYKMVYEGYKDGILSHADIAKILHILLRYKFTVDIPEGSKNKVWYEFVLDDDDYIDGELYKWRQWPVLPSSLSTYISETLPNLFDKVLKRVKEKYNSSDGDISKYYNKVLQNFKSTMRKLGDRNFKRNVIQEAEDKFFKRGFAMKLDKDPLIRGVQNGVLKLTLAPGGRPMLIQGYHSYLVSKYTEMPYIAFNPYDPLTKRILITLRNMFPDEEPDSFDFTMYYLSSTIDGKPKESMFMIMTGSGANGKSFLVELHKGAIGNTYGVKMPLSYLTCRSSHADSATPAQMQLKDATFAYYSESNRHEKLNAARVKEVTGLETIAGRKLHQDMINFKPRCHHLATTNYDFDIECNDFGTWRRIEYNPLKITFRDTSTYKLDEKNPYEREADPEVTQVWTESADVQGRYLGFMVWKHYWLYRKYYGKVKSVPHPHIAFETEKYRRRQDTITEFLSQRCVKCADPNLSYSLNEQIQKYILWYARNNGNTLPAKGICEQFQNSQIGKHIKLTARGWYIYGHRFITNGEELADGETYAMENVFKIKAPANNFGIKPESSEEYYKRVCKEYDEVKHIFTGDAKYDVDLETVIDYHVIGGSSQYEQKYNDVMKNGEPIPLPKSEARKDNVSSGLLLPSGIVLTALEEPSVNYLTDEYHVEMSGFLKNHDDMAVEE